MFLSVFLSESVGANATKDESKDPENTSTAMPSQGILPKLLPLLSSSMETSERKNLRKNSLQRHGKG